MTHNTSSIDHTSITTLRIGRTRFSSKRAVETLQQSFKDDFDVNVNVIRGKLGEIEITGKAPSVFSVGMFILEDVILREKPILYPLITLSFYQNQSVEYFFLPSANYHATFKPKNPMAETPIFFLKKLSHIYAGFINNFIKVAGSSAVWRLNKLRYECITDENPTIREDDKLEFIVFVGATQQVIQSWHHIFTTAFLSHVNPNLLSAASVALTGAQPATQTTYSPFQLCTFDMDQQHRTIMINSDNLNAVNNDSVLNEDLNVNYDQVKSLYRPPTDVTIDPILDQLLVAIYYSNAGQHVINEATRFGKPTFIGMREIFAKLACTPYQNDDPKTSYEYTVMRRNGTITISAPSISNLMIDKLSYHNYQFAQKCTKKNLNLFSRAAGSVGGGNIWSHEFSDATSFTSTGQLHEYTKFCTVVNSHIGSHNVIIGGQVDAYRGQGPFNSYINGLPNQFNTDALTAPLRYHNIDNVSLCSTIPRFNLNQFVEIKTCGSLEDYSKEHYRRETLHSLYMQSLLIGTSSIIQGFVDKEKKGVVKKVAEESTASMLVDQNMVDKSLHFLEKVLTMLEENTLEGRKYVLLFAPPSSHVSLLYSNGEVAESMPIVC